VLNKQQATVNESHLKVGKMSSRYRFFILTELTINRSLYQILISSKAKPHFGWVLKKEIDNYFYGKCMGIIFTCGKNFKSFEWFLKFS